MVELPADVARQTGDLQDAIDDAVPVRAPSNLLIATWNLRAFGALTKSWDVGNSDSPKRDWRAVALIRTIAEHFDVIALQEVRRDTTALRFLLELLGDPWHVISSDVTEGKIGNGERLAFVYDANRVQPSGLVGEVVLPPNAVAPARQFARTPYVASFTKDGVEFVLTTVHVLWGSNPSERLPEVRAFAEWMRAWATRKGEWNSNLLVLGDFNLDRIGNPLFDAFLETGLWAPTELDLVPRTIFHNDGDENFYDQIAWFSNPMGESLLRELEYSGHAGSFDFVPHVYPLLTKNELSWRISDHYPLWAEFVVAA